MIFLTITWLALASLNSATVHSAVVLRDRAKSDLVTLSDSIFVLTFQNLMDDVVDGMVIAALFSIFGFILVTYLNWLQENCAARSYYWCFQIVVSMIVLTLGGWITSRVHGFQTSFEFFDRSHIPYYKVMYYGSVGQAAFGSLVIIMSLVRFAVCGVPGSLAEKTYRATKQSKRRLDDFQIMREVEAKKN